MDKVVRIHEKPLKRILITGGGGFVARHLAPYLCNAGFDVVVTSRNPQLKFDDVRIATALHPSASQGWAQLLNGVDAVVHLAGLAHRTAGADEHNRINHILAADAAEAAKRCGVQHFILVSSIAAQSGASAPNVLKETDAPKPGGDYGAAKLAAERALVRTGIGFTILRPVVIEGPDAKGNAATLNAIARIPLPLPFGNLQNRRSTLSIGNFNSAIAAVLFNPKAMGETFIVADPNAVTVTEMFERARHSAGNSASLFKVDPGLLKLGLQMVGRGALWERLGGSLVADPSKLMSIGWKPERG